MRLPFAGRAAELSFLAGVLSSGTERGVVLSGAAGVGKTRLAEEVSRLAGADGCAVAWVRATRSAASVPLGAFAPLLDGGDGRLPEGVELLTRARRALADRAAGRRLVLCVDDGHLLDDASAALVHQLVAATEAFALVTLRRDEPAPDAVRALVKEDLCPLLEVGRLTREDADAMLAVAVGGPLDGATSAALRERADGNALFLRELVRHGLDCGRLTEDGGVWRWHGPVEAGTRLADLVDLRIDAVAAGARALLELVAVGAPLELAVLLAAAPGAADALEELERAELVQRHTDGRRRFVDVGHPLQGEAVRARLTASRLDALRCRLAAEVERAGTRRSGDVLRIATWRLDAGARGDGKLFTRAAAHALAARDPALAERLARAAIDAGAGFPAALVLARALAAAGDGVGAEARYAALADDAGDDDARAAEVAVARARNLFWALDRADDAHAVLEAAERRVRGAALRHDLAAQRVRLTAAHGRPAAALAAAAPLLADERVDEPARMTAAMGAVEALFSSGCSAEAVALAEAWLPVAVRRRHDLPAAEAVLLGMRAMALRLFGDLERATVLSEAAYELAVARRSAPATAVEATSLALIWLGRGRVTTALRLARESAALLRGADAVGMRAFALAAVAQAAAQLGDPAAASSAVDAMERTPLGHKAFAVELQLARAWSAAAAGRFTRAREHARAAAAAARDRGQDAYAVRALHDLARLGDPAHAAAALAELAPRTDGPFAAAAAAHAAASAVRDGGALLEAAERLAGLGALLAAAEAADAAAAAHRDAGRQASARTAAARAGLWLASCEGARPPTLVAIRDATGLTPREREIALMAAGGSSSREIAERLVVSVRTVDNHLQNAYRKLGISSRGDLPGALSGAGAVG
jgi:DNA-binding CsgD family transcriptional regulator